MAAKSNKDTADKDKLKAGEVSENKTETGRNDETLTSGATENKDNSQAETGIADLATSNDKATTATPESPEEKKEETKKEKVMYIGPNIRGLLQNTVFEYMPDIENYKEYVNIEKLFVKLPEVKKSILQIKEKSNVLHIIYDEVQKIEDKKRKEREF
ncbi:hypothetical protein [Sebaldella termitidis]|uniref:hypothetical protein n=1 Tax=Sebaldella termitidis TaxID=826 RepID=UPI003EBBD8B0